MINKEDKSFNPKIGRPVKTLSGTQFKKDYLQNEVKFELECELLATMHENFFVDPPSDPKNRRMQIQFLTVLFEQNKSIEIFQILLDLNQFFYKNSSIIPDDPVRYTTFIDVAYLIRQIKIKRGNFIRSVDLVLTIIFFLQYFLSQHSNEKLINYQSYQYLKPRIKKIANDMIAGENPQRNQKIQLLFINLILELCVKEEVKIIR